MRSVAVKPFGIQAQRRELDELEKQKADIEKRERRLEAEQRAIINGTTVEEELDEGCYSYDSVVENAVSAPEKPWRGSEASDRPWGSERNLTRCFPSRRGFRTDASCRHGSQLRNTPLFHSYSSSAGFHDPDVPAADGPSILVSLVIIQLHDHRFRRDRICLVLLEWIWLAVHGKKRCTTALRLYAPQDSRPGVIRHVRILQVFNIYLLSGRKR